MAYPFGLARKQLKGTGEAWERPDGMHRLLGKKSSKKLRAYSPHSSTRQLPGLKLEAL